MAIEIERKFLVDKFNAEKLKERASSHYEIYQNYISINPEVRVRAYKQPELPHEYYELIVKVGKGLCRVEESKKISAYSYGQILRETIGGVQKRRYEIHNFEGYKGTLELDEFLGPHRGIYICELEFNTKEEAMMFIPKDYMREVTNNKQYRNCNLAIRRSSYIEN